MANPSPPIEGGGGIPRTEWAILHGLVHDRIRELLKERQWWRDNRWADWSDIRKEDTIELRALVRLARDARRQAEPEQADLLTAGKAYHDWQSGR